MEHYHETDSATPEELEWHRTTEAEWSSERVAHRGD
jgi:hypothetical protein